MTALTPGTRYIKKNGALVALTGGGSGGSGGTGDATALGTLHARLAARLTTPARMVFLGSSTTDSGQYITRLLAAIQAAYPAAAGSTEPAVIKSTASQFGTLSATGAVHAYNGGVGGTNSSNYIDDDRVARIAAMTPAAVMHMVGSNDYAGQTPKATYKSFMTSWLGKFRAARPGIVHLLVQPYQRTDVATPAGVPWSAYGEALRELADASPADTLYVDLAWLYGVLGVPGADVLDLLSGDNIHQTDLGHTVMAEALRLALRVPDPVAPAPDTTAPTTPTGLTVGAVTTTTVALSWTASTDAVGVTGYRVRRGGTIVGTPAGTTFTDTGRSAGTQYSYTVSAIDAAGNESAPTAAVTATTTAYADTTAPTVPTGLAAGTATSTTIPLTWTASTDAVGVAGYRVYRNGTLVGSPTTTSYTDSGLTASTAYSYTVSAVDAAGNESAQSAAITPSTAAAAGGVTTYAADDFNRANGPLGSTPVGGFAWQMSPADYFQIVSQGAKANSSQDGASMWISDGQQNGTLTANISAVAQGLLFRATDGVGYYFFYSSSAGAWRFGRKTGPTAYTPIVAAPAAAFAAGTVEVVMDGSNFTFRVNGTQVLTATDTTYTGTQHGLMQQGGIATFDNFSHTSATT